MGENNFNVFLIIFKFFKFTQETLPEASWEVIGCFKLTNVAWTLLPLQYSFGSLWVDDREERGIQSEVEVQDKILVKI